MTAYYRRLALTPCSRAELPTNTDSKMSYCQIIPFAEGLPQSGIEFRNAWGGAARIWSALFDAYLKNPAIPYHSWMGSADELWSLAKREDLPTFERAVHASTFDHAYISRENFGRFAGDLRQFAEKYPVPGAVDHLLPWAEWIEASDAEAVGFHGTSVAENPWWVWDEEKDDSTPTPLKVASRCMDGSKVSVSRTLSNGGSECRPNPMNARHLKIMKPYQDPAPPSSESPSTPCSHFYAFRLPEGLLKRWKAKRCSHDWRAATATISVCQKCGTNRKRLGVFVIRDERGDETGELEQSDKLLSRHLIDYSKGGWFLDANVKEHAPLSAGASVDHGVKVETMREHGNRAADRGCCVSTCSASFLFLRWRFQQLAKQL